MSERKTKQELSTFSTSKHNNSLNDFGARTVSGLHVRRAEGGPGQRQWVENEVGSESEERLPLNFYYTQRIPQFYLIHLFLITRHTVINLLFNIGGGLQCYVLKKSFS